MFATRIRFLTGLQHLASLNNVSGMMLKVLVALLPAIFVSALLLGAGIFVQIFLATISALICEAAILTLRKRPIKTTLLDFSAFVTAVLLAVCLPTLAPWWISVLGTFFAIVIVKQLYGGLGHNPFNPAMAGYAFLLISFPQPMTAWLAFDAPNLGLSDVFQLIFHEKTTLNVDVLTQATPLDTIRTQLRLNQSLSQIYSLPIFGIFAGKSYQWIALSYFLGGLWLLKQKVIRWEIPVSVLASLGVCALVGYFYDSAHFSSPLFHLFAGSSLFGAFFIATDPVTAATSSKGRMVYGALIGGLLYAIRTWGNYPDGFAFAILVANLAVPTIDAFTKPAILQLSK